MDVCKRIYDLLKNGMSIPDICNELGVKNIRYLLLFIYDNWMDDDYDDIYAFFDFIYILPYDWQIFRLVEDYMLFYQTQPLNYHKEYSDIIKTVFYRYIGNFHYTRKITWILVYKEYLDNEDLLNIYLNYIPDRWSMKRLLRNLNKSELFDTLFFMKQMIGE